MTTVENLEGRPQWGRPFVIVWSIVGIVAPWFVSWLQVKPNRIVEGVAASIGSLDPFGAILLSLCWAVPLCACFFALNPAARSNVIVGASILGPIVAILVCSKASQTIVGGNEIVRVSLSWGFWGTLLFSYATFILFSVKLYRPLAARLLGLIVPLFLLIVVGLGVLDSTSILMEYHIQSETFWAEVLRHIQLSTYAVLVGGVFGVAIGLLASRSRTFRQLAFAVLNGVQTIPSLAFFGLMIAPLAALSIAFPVLRDWGIGGIGAAPALIALTLYALFPVARNTATAFAEVPSAVLDAGRGMGMSRLQLLVRVELPLSSPLIVEGLRTASVQTIGNTVLVAFIGAGGLGSLIFQGLGQYAVDLILLGALPVLALALIVDSLWAGIVLLVGSLSVKTRNT